MWPEGRMVRGSPRRSSTNGGVERLNRTLENKLGSWMAENNSKHWSIGCKIIAGDIILKSTEQLVTNRLTM